MLSKEAKEAAARMFRLPDPDATGSTTASEDELEVLQRYPGKLSPKSSVSRYRKQIEEATKTKSKKMKKPVKKPTGWMLSDEDESRLYSSRQAVIRTIHSSSASRKRRERNR